MTAPCHRWTTARRPTFRRCAADVHRESRRGTLFQPWFNGRSEKSYSKCHYQGKL